MKKLFLATLFLLIANFAAAQDQALHDAIEMFNRGDLDDAEIALNDYLRSNPQETLATFYLARVIFDKEDYGKATKLFEKAFEEDGSNSMYALWVGRSFGRRAQSASKLKQPYLAKKTKAFFEKAVELDPNNIEARIDVIQYYLQAPGFLGGSLDKAKKEAEAIKEIDPVEGYLAWADIHANQNDPVRQKSELRTAISNHPNYPEPYYRLGRILANEKQFEEALNLVEEVKAVDTVKTNPFYSEGLFLQMAERYEEAIPVYEQILELDPEETYAHYMLGRISTEAKIQPDLGEEHLLAYINQDEAPSKVMLSWAHYRLGLVYEMQENSTKAKDQYETALSYDKKHERAKNALSNLK